MRDAHFRASARIDLRAARDGEHCERGVDGDDGSRDGTGDFSVALGEIGERSMRLHEGNFMTDITRHRDRGAELIGDRPLDLGGRHWQRSPPKAGEIGKRNMRPDGDAERLRLNEAARHDIRVAGVKTAGDIGAGHDAQHRGVIAHAPNAKTLAQIGVEIDARQRTLLNLATDYTRRRVDTKPPPPRAYFNPQSGNLPLEALKTSGSKLTAERPDASREAHCFTSHRPEA